MARQARGPFFHPGFDEPAFKSVFDISLEVLDADSCQTCLSNTDVKNVSKFKNEENQEVTRYNFETTPIMSTYLLAFVFGNYDFFESHTSSGIRVRCYTPVNKTDLGRFATETAVKCLEFYENYFGIEYPLKKLDIRLFHFAAMSSETTDGVLKTLFWV